MSSYDLSHVTDVGTEFSAGPSVSMWDMVQQGFRQQYRVDSALALDEELRTRWARSLQALRATGQNFGSPVDPLMYRGYARFVREGTPVTMPTVEGEGYGARINWDLQQPHSDFVEMQRADEAIRQLNNPQIRSFQQILDEVGEMQRGVEQDTASMSERAPTGSFIAELIGAVGGSFSLRDPLNVVTAPVGAGRTVATRILSDMAIAAGVTTATEFGDVAPNRALAGLPERNPLMSIGAATLGAGIIRGGIEGIGYGIRRLRGGDPEGIDFNLRDSQLQQMFEANSHSPTARAGAQALSDIAFIERNNPYGEGQAANLRFMAELQEVQRLMGGEPMTAVARVLPPLPFEFIQKEADFLLVKEQAPLVYARMEVAQARVANLQNGSPYTRAYHGTARDFGDFSVDKAMFERAVWFTSDPEVASGYAKISSPGGYSGSQVRFNDLDTSNFAVRDMEGRKYNAVEVKEALDQARAENKGGVIFKNYDDSIGGVPKTSDVIAVLKEDAIKSSFETSTLRRAAIKEYETGYRAVEAEVARIREEQARVESAQQRQAVNIFADATYGRPFNWSILQHDFVQERIDAINAFNDTLDEKAVAAFVRETEEEAGDVLKNESGEPLTFYHGTSREFSDEGDLPGQEGKWTFFATKPEVAEEFARAGTLPNRIYPVKLRAKNIGDFRDPAQVEAVKEFVTARFEQDSREVPQPWLDAIEKGGWGVWERDWIADHFGWDAVWITEKGELNIAVRSPDQITSAVGWQAPDGRIDIGLSEPVDPNFRIITDDGDISIADAMRDLQDDADLDEAMRTCLR